jgi:hypothetical protein
VISIAYECYDHENEIAEALEFSIEFVYFANDEIENVNV